MLLFWSTLESPGYASTQSLQSTYVSWIYALWEAKFSVRISAPDGIRIQNPQPQRPKQWTLWLNHGFWQMMPVLIKVDLPQGLPQKTTTHYTYLVRKKLVNYIATWTDVIITGLVMLTLITHEKFCHNKTFIYNS